MPFARLPQLLLLACLAGAGACATLPDVGELRADAAQEQSGGGKPRIKGRQGLLSPGRTAAILRELERQGKTSLLDRHFAFMQTLHDKPLTAGNGARLLIDGPRTYAAMFEAIAAAKDHVNLETYILEEDEIGRKFAALLAQKAGEGVQVNLMYDSVGSINTSRAFFDALRGQGVNVCEFNPVNPVKGRLFSLNNRDHRKLLVVDGQVSFTGGINISNVYASSIFGSRRREVKQEGWRDTHIEVRGPATQDFQRLFIDNWGTQACGRLPQRQYFPQPVRGGDQVVQAIGSSPGDALNLIYLELLSAISHAERSVWITMAYFVPDAQTTAALKDAVKRGVDVTLVLPGFSDYWITFYAGRSYYDELLAAGVRIYERRDALLHAKTAVIDGVWSTVGSTNMDLRSFLHNHEVNAVVLGAEFAGEMERVFRRDLEESVPIDPKAWEKRGAAERAKETLARMWAYWL